MRKIPYGISNFERLIEENYIYVDKTKYIEILEQFPPYQFFIRPRRFGKSLFTSMLEKYYDINKKDKFESLFGNLYIGKNPTQERNTYLVFKISFAGIDTTQSKEKLIESFDFKVLSSLREFLDKYGEMLNEYELPEHIDSAEKALEYIRRITKKNNKKIIVLIDEYDNFANDIMNANKDLYYNLIAGEGYVRTFYKALKEGTVDSISRIFMTGVSPIMLDDLTSGFNITDNLTMNPRLNGALGFTEEEVICMLKEFKVEEFMDIDKVIADMRKYYNGYLFSRNGRNKIYNSDMALYFIKYLVSNYEYPHEMIDNNVKTDYGRVNKIALNFKDEKTVEEIMREEALVSRIVDRFNLETMFNNKENFISLLYYLGMLTIKKSLGYEVELGIPNQVIREIFWEQFLEKLRVNIEIDNRKIMDSISKMQRQGKIEDFIECVKDILEKLSNRDLQNFDEKYIKVIMMTLLNMNKMYVIDSEREVEKGYIDIFLTKAVQYKEYVDYEWIIELKYIRESDRKKLQETKEQALEQLKGYDESYQIEKGLGKEKVRKIVVIVIGKKDVYFEKL
ncbi:AAA family ATPase [Clostridium sp. MB40-C1]|uniref:ATP-binding protein n=1 Tax=Clostridium sp. MB40-C1 TaxID=3070996 RepID=UPI0027DF6E55|nr:ATP-binding protein [Clostridium sp. MB40-C1]WMJ79487.1 AAA family ATPase [Clostridium sp. MB40-C1]